MKEITVVTGPLRSGTSCVTGLLELCGFDLGRNVRILRRQTEHNPHGHFEPDLLFAINERLLQEVPSGHFGIFRVPGESALTDLAARRKRYFRFFIRKFDGELCKDPLMCLTFPFWEEHWPEINRVVFCLRHPLAAARSMEKRYGLSQEDALELWRAYSTRFFGATKRSEVFVFDFDAFTSAPTSTFSTLLAWLRRPMKAKGIEERLKGFYDRAYVHWSFTETDLQDVPEDLKQQYLEIRARAGICRG